MESGHSGEIWELCLGKLDFISVWMGKSFLEKKLLVCGYGL